MLLVGFAGVMYPSAPAAADSILPHMILQTGLPAIVVGLFCAGALAASMSTGDALLHRAASIAVEDGIKPFVKIADARRRHLMQILVLVIGGVAFYLAVILNVSLAWLLLTAYGLIDQLAPPVYAALFWRKATTHAVLSGLAAGMATSVFFLMRPELRPFEIHEGILGLVVNVGVLVAVTHARGPERGGGSRAA